MCCFLLNQLIAQSGCDVGLRDDIVKCFGTPCSIQCLVHPKIRLRFCSLSVWNNMEKSPQKFRNIGVQVNCGTQNDPLNAARSPAWHGSQCFVAQDPHTYIPEYFVWFATSDVLIIAHGKRNFKLFFKKNENIAKKKFFSGNWQNQCLSRWKGKVFFVGAAALFEGLWQAATVCVLFLLCILFVTIFHGFSTDYAKIFPFFHKNKAAELFEMHKVPQKADNESCNLVTDVL